MTPQDVGGQERKIAATSRMKYAGESYKTQERLFGRNRVTNTGLSHIQLQLVQFRTFLSSVTII